MRTRFLYLLVTISLIATLLLERNSMWGLYPPGYFNPLLRFWEFGLGMLAFTIPITVKIKKFISLLLITIVLSRIGSGSMIPTLIVVGSTFLFVSSRTQISIFELSQKVRSIILWIGNHSYEIYLLHWPLLAFPRIVNPNFTPFMCFLYVCILIASTFLLGNLSSLFAKISHPHISILGGIIVLIISSLGIQSGGVPSRLPESLRNLSAANSDYLKMYDSGKCFNPEFQKVVAVEAECLFSGESSLFLWGDSHAAHLRPGFEALYGKSFSFLSVSSCKPWRIDSRSLCGEINSIAFDLIDRKTAQTIVIANAWNFDAIRNLPIFLQSLQANSNKLLVVGPVPRWESPLEILFPKTSMQNLPIYSHNGLDMTVVEIDKQLKQIAKEKDVVYVSLIDELCNSSGVKSAQKVMIPRS